MTLNL